MKPAPPVINARICVSVTQWRWGPTPSANSRRSLASDLPVLGAGWPQARLRSVAPGPSQRELAQILASDLPVLGAGWPQARLRSVAPGPSQRELTQILASDLPVLGSGWPQARLHSVAPGPTPRD